MMRQVKFFQAVREAFDEALTRDPSVYVMGLGVPDPKGVFGTTLGLAEKHGADRVMDMPTAENGMTGVAIGTALGGMRPIMMHQRLDFALLAVEQIVNQAAKWHYMFGGRQKIPLIVRMIIGRGWGQGPQHSQSLHNWFAHIPGLKVVMPVTPHDAKGLMLTAVEDNNPIIYIDHRWLHNTHGEVPEGHYRVPFGQARIARLGKDVSIVASSYMVLEALRAAEALKVHGIDAEVIDLRTIRPLDTETILSSVSKTGHLIAADISWTFSGFAGEIVATVAEQAFDQLKAPPRRIGLADCPVPATPALSKYVYPRAEDFVKNVCEMLGVSPKETRQSMEKVLLDVPDPSFTGPF